MPNIFDGIEKMQEDQLSSQLATLKEVTMTNVLGEMGQKISNKTIKLFNGARKLFNAKPVKEPKVIPLDQRIANSKMQIQYMSKKQLIEETRNTIVDRLKSLSMGLSEYPSDDEISICVIEAASKNFKGEIGESLSPAQKADAIYQRYNERLINQIQEKYNETSEFQKREIKDKIQKDVDQMSEEQKEELRKALHVDEITGATISKLLTTSAGASTLLIALNASGFGAFVALTTIMHAVFTTTLGITLPFAAYTTSTSILSFFLGPAGWIILAGAEFFMFKNNKNKLIYELLSQVVWASVIEYGGRFTPKDDMLPSWLPEKELEVAVADNEEYMNLQRRFNSLKEDIEDKGFEIDKQKFLQKSREYEITKLQDEIKIKEREAKAAEADKSRLKNELIEARKEFEKYKQYADSENEALLSKYEDAKEKYKYANRELELNESDIDCLKRTNKEYEEKIQLYKEELDCREKEINSFTIERAEMQKTIDTTGEKLKNLELKQCNKLKERWEVAFKRFEFDKGVIKYVVKNYQYNEYGYIERRLMELHEAKDPAALNSNRGKMAVTGQLHLEVSTPTGFPSRIFYSPLKNSGEKKVRITEIYKHNYSRYGKA